jgi:hypothetical protein
LEPLDVHGNPKSRHVKEQIPDRGGTFERKDTKGSQSEK